MDEQVQISDWFVREEVMASLNDALPEIAKYLMDNDVDYETDTKGLSTAVMMAVKDIDFTMDELEYAVDVIQVYTAVRELIAEGHLEELEDGTIQCPKSSQQ